MVYLKVYMYLVFLYFSSSWNSIECRPDPCVLSIVHSCIKRKIEAVDCKIGISITAVVLLLMACLESWSTCCVMEPMPLYEITVDTPPRTMQLSVATVYHLIWYLPSV